MKRIFLMIILTTLGLTACASASNGPQAGSTSSSGPLPMATQLLVGTTKLDGSEQDVTAEQAAELLPLWQVYSELLTSDTAAQEEIDGLVDQIQETMTEEQMQAISDMSLTQQDVFALMQEKGSGIVQSSQNSSGTSSQRNDGFSGPPDGGGSPSGGAGFPGSFSSGGQTIRGSDSTTTDSAQSTSGGGVSSALIETLIEMLKSKAGS